MRTAFEGDLIPAETARADVRATAAQVAELSSQALPCTEELDARNAPLALVEVATARRLRLARGEVGSGGRASRDRGWAGFSLLHAAADMVACEVEPVEDHSPLLLLRSLQLGRLSSFERDADRIHHCFC